MNPDILNELPKGLFPGIIYVYDLRNGGEFFVNDQFEELLGYTDDVIKSQGASFMNDLLHPDDKERVAGIMDALTRIDPGESVRMEYRLRDQGGRWRWFADFSCVSEVKADSGVVQIMGTAIEITDKKETQESFEKLHRLFQQVIEAMPLALCWKNKEGQYQGYNTRFLKGLELDVETDIRGQKDHALPWSDEHCQEIENVDAQVLTSGEIDFERIEAYEDDAATHLVKVSRFPLLDTEGKIIGLLTTRQDATEEIAAPDIVQGMEQRYQILLDSSPGAVYLTSVEGRVLEANRVAIEWSQLLDQSQGETFRIWHLLPEPRQDDFRNWIQEVVDADRGDLRRDKFLAKDENEISVEVRLILIRKDKELLLRFDIRESHAEGQKDGSESSAVLLLEECQMMLEAMPAPYALLNKEGQLVRANKRWRECFSAHSEKEHRLIDLVRETDRNTLEKAIAAVIEKRSTHKAAFSISSDNALAIRYSASFSFFENKSNECFIQCILSVCAEDNNANAEPNKGDHASRLGVSPPSAVSSLDSSLHVYIEMDEACRLLSWSKAAELLFEFPVEEARSKDIIRLLVPRKERPKLYAHLKDITSSEAIVPYEASVVTQKKAAVNCHWYFSPIAKGENGSVAYTAFIYPLDVAVQSRGGVKADQGSESESRATPADVKGPELTAIDLTRIRVLYVSKNADNRDKAEQVIKELGCEVRCCASMNRVVSILKIRSYHVVILDYGESEKERSECVRRIRKDVDDAIQPSVMATCSSDKQPPEVDGISAWVPYPIAGETLKNAIFKMNLQVD